MHFGFPIAADERDALDRVGRAGQGRRRAHERRRRPLRRAHQRRRRELAAVPARVAARARLRRRLPSRARRAAATACASAAPRATSTSPRIAASRWQLHRQQPAAGPLRPLRLSDGRTSRSRATCGASSRRSKPRDVPGATVREVIEELERRHPGLRLATSSTRPAACAGTSTSSSATSRSAIANGSAMRSRRSSASSSCRRSRAVEPLQRRHRLSSRPTVRRLASGRLHRRRSLLRRTECGRTTGSCADRQRLAVMRDGDGAAAARQRIARRVASRPRRGDSARDGESRTPAASARRAAAA